jgi:type III secretion protein C
MVSGPKRYVELVKQAANTSDRSNDIEDTTTTIRVFNLKYAFADDYTVNSGGREVRVPGLVSVLRQSFGGEVQGRLIADGRRTGINSRRSINDPGENPGGGNSLGNASGRNVSDRGVGDGGQPPDTNPILPTLDGRGDGRGDGRNDKRSSGGSSLGQREGSVDRGESDNSGSSARGVPSFSADPRTNAVIVRDIPSRIDQYEAVIKRLDEQPRLVEIQTTILEVNTEAFSELGIDWRASGSRGQLEVGGGGISNAVTQPNGTLPNAGANAGANALQSLGNIAGTALTVMTGGRAQLLARISALEQERKATVTAQPVVTTLNNVEVSLDATETFYVPVQGYQSGQLYDVSAGTSIQFTPSIVSADTPPVAGKEADKDLIRMLIKIEDGNTTNQKVSALPTVRRMKFGTHSLVLDGSTLLIAGYSKEVESRDQNGVPGLSSLPIIGNLFKSTAKNRTRVERLFMITPRVVDVRNAQMARPLQMLPSAQDTAPPVQRAAADATPSPAPPAVTVRPVRDAVPTTEAAPAPVITVVTAYGAAPQAAPSPVAVPARAATPAAVPTPAPPSPSPSPTAATYALGLSPVQRPVAAARSVNTNASASVNTNVSANVRTDAPPVASQAAWALGLGAQRPAAAASGSSRRNDVNGSR